MANYDKNTERARRVVKTIKFHVSRDYSTEVRWNFLWKKRKERG